MMSTIDKNTDAAVVRGEAVGRGLLGLGRPKVPPPPSPEVHLYLHSLRPDGTRKLERIVSKDDRPPASERTTALYVATTPQSLEAAFPAAARDADGVPWDLRLEGTWSVDDSRRFVQRYAADVVTPGAPLSNRRVNAWMADEALDKIRRATSGQSIEDLRARGADYWSDRLNEWFIDSGLVFAVRHAAWTSAEADAARAEDERQRQLRRVEEARQNRREAELREAASMAEFESEKARIATDRELSEAERAQRLQLAEIEHRRRLIEAEESVEEARRRSERAELEHELSLAKLQNDVDAARRAESDSTAIETRHRETMDKLAELRRTLEQAAAAPGNLLGAAVGGDTAAAHDALDRLTTLHGIAPEALATLGIGTPAHALLNAARSKATRDGDAVRLKKTDLRTRDIGTVRVQALPVNTSLRFELFTGRPGYVTLINVGTSGRAYLHVPNAWVQPGSTKVAGGRAFPIPGPPLMPWERLREQGFDYVEIGPPGWEHMVALVTPEAVVEPPTIDRAAPAAPFVELSADELHALCGRLEKLSDSAWSAGVMSFLVE